MKALRFLILGFAVTALTAYGQTGNEPAFYTLSRTTPQQTLDSIQTQSLSQNASPLYSQTSPIAETITPDIQALADGLQDNPVKIFDYVHDHIKFVLYFGSMKGAELTLLEKSGNDFDQCALLVALLRAAGYSPGYGFGWVGVPFQATDGTDNDLRHWLHLTFSNTNWNYTDNYLIHMFSTRGYPATWTPGGGDTNTLIFQHVWVTLSIGSTNYVLDPSFKVSERVAPQINLESAMGFSSNAVMSAANGTDANDYVQNLDEASLDGTLTRYTTNLLNYLQNNDPNASVQDVLGGWQIVPSTGTTLSQSLLFTAYKTLIDSRIDPDQDWTDEPTNLMTSLTITFAHTNYEWWMPALNGDRLTLLYDANGLAQLWQEDTLLASNQTTATDTNVVLNVDHPYGTWNYSSNTLTDGTFGDQSQGNMYQRLNSIYDILYAFEPDWGWLQKRESKLDTYFQEGLTNGTRQVTSETLNVMGLNWLLQSEAAEQILDDQLGILPEYAHRLGRMAQEAGRGYYVDVYMQASADLSDSSIDFIPASDVSTYFASALEHGVIEQLQDSNLVAASTVKMLQIADTNGQAVYIADSNNWSSVQNNLVHYDLTALGNLIGQGYTLLLPHDGAFAVAGSGTWNGYGIVARGIVQGKEAMDMLIGGGYNGGYISLPVTVNSSYVNFSGDVQPLHYTDTSAFTFNLTAGDPVDMANGTFQIEHTDLSIGGKEPRGITLSRYYNGARRFSNPSGMADGWINNYTISANTVAAPQAGLGGTTPAQMAPMLVATAAAAGIYSVQNPDPKNWLVTALIAKWGVDQLTKGGVSVQMGKDTVQFVKQPDGTYTPPANCTMTLLETNGSYWLQQRHGNAFKFDSLGRLTNIVDQYAEPLTVSYLNSTSSLPQTVTDWKGRSLTFHYTGTPLRLDSVSDNSSPSRTVYYGYGDAYNTNGDLTSFEDADGNTSRYEYDTNHEITATIDALSRLVVSNNYDALGHVTTQLTQGDTNKTWHIFWSDWQTIAQDPAGGDHTYFYDDRHRLIAQQDALSNLSETFYDGQDHVVETVSPLNETNLYSYDGDNNLVAHVDPLGYTNRFFYDSQNLLYRSTDGRGDPTTYGYNSEFSLTGQTNAAGDWANYIYNTSGADAGTLASRDDAGFTTHYDGYDTWGQLTHITYANNDTESFVNDAEGDVTSHTDGNGNTTQFQYDNRRELTNTIAPTNVVTSQGFDAVGNVQTVTDARHFTTTKVWSPTRHLLSTVLPAMPQGVPVITNIYDNRDWLAETLDPLQEPTSYTNNADHWLIAQTDPLKRPTWFTHDADGRTLATINAASETNSQTWDARGDQIALTDGAGHASMRAYDGAGNQTILTNRRDKVWHFQFDAANRLTNSIPPSPMNPSSRTFNQRGLVSTATDPAGQITHFYYDGRKRLTNRTDNIGTTLYAYDADNNRTRVSENGLTNSWTYDAYNRVSTYHDAYGNLIQYRYDADGNLTNLVYPGNKNVYYAYDSNNHLTNVTDWANRETTLIYDLAGRLKEIIRPNKTTRTLSYDSAGQVTNIWEQMANGLPIAWFRYDWNSNATMHWEFAAPLPHTNSPPTRIMTYNDDNELATFQGPTMASSQNVNEDNNGNLTYAPLTNDTFVTYHFDARNRLQDVGDVTNIYDGMNNRIRQYFGTNATTFVVNPNSALPQVLERIKNGVTTYYIYGAGLLYQVTETATSTNALFYHYDYRGSTVALTDNNGLVKDRFEYSLYASLTYRAGNDDTPFLFNGRYGVMSEPNGLLYMRARYYDPYLCRFINPDPTGFKAGLNFYVFAMGNCYELF